MPRSSKARTKLEENTFRGWLLFQDEIWVDIKGRVHPIEQMDREYRMNVLAFVLRDWRFEGAAGNLASAARRANPLLHTPLIQRLIQTELPYE